VAKVVPGESQALILFLFLWVWLPHVMYVCARVVCVLCVVADARVGTPTCAGR
jgi:hypothetical protein